MGYIKDISFGNSTYPIEPMLYAVGGGTSSAITASISNFDLHTGASVQIKMAADNSSNATLNVESTGAKSIYYKGSAITAGLLESNGIYCFVYDGTNWVVTGRIVKEATPLVVSIPSGQWSGSAGDYYISVNASNVTTNSILVPNYDSDSAEYLNGPVWCVPASGSFTIHTSALPSDTVTIMVQFPGTMGEAQYQVLADVYSTSQAVAKADIIDTLTSTATDKPLSAAQGKVLYDDKVQRYGFGGTTSSISRTITFTGSVSMLLAGFATSSDRMTLTMVYGRGANSAPILVNIVTSSVITMTATAGQLKIESSNANSTTYYACVFSGIDNFTVA